MMRFSNLQEWLSWQESLHPSAIDLGLERVHAVWRRMGLGKPNNTIVTVAGTNGKGSCVAMLDAIYRASGYKVGTYTSPHIKRYNERVCINGEPVSDEALCNAFEHVDRCRGEISLTYFEFGTLAALVLFQQAQLEIVILEVGLGGRLDAVNIVDADVAVISSIDLDHEAWLGSDRASIALEKAGIARTGVATVCGDLNPPNTLLEYLDKIQSPLSLINRNFHFEKIDAISWNWRSQQHQHHNLPLPALRGDFQLQNAATVLMVLEILQSQHPVTQSEIRQGLTMVFVPGRFQVVPGPVRLIVDVAHNPHGAGALAQALSQWPCHGTTIGLFGAMHDKDVAGMASAMNEVIDEWLLVELPSPRAMSTQALKSVFRTAGIDKPIECFGSVQLAKESAIDRASPEDRIVAFGSFFVVSELL